MTIPSDEFSVIELASKLVTIPSVTGDEGRLGTFLAAWLAAAGLQVQTMEVAPGRRNVLAVLPALGSDQPAALQLLFHGHLDTTPAHGMKDPFSGQVADGYIWGRGSVDQKGGLAAAAAALAFFAQRSSGPHPAVGLIAVVDEESEHRGSMHLAQSGLRASRAIITEPSGLRVVIGCKGTVPLRVHVHGRAAHGCRPWLGVNAVEKAIKVAQALMSQSFREVPVPGLPPVRGSINLGVMNGGVAYNIVPDTCELWFDRRTVPGESQPEVLAHAQALLDRLSAQDPELQAEVEIARPDWHWEPVARRGLKPTMVPPGSPLPAWLSMHHAHIVGSPPDRYFTDGYNEMDFLINDMGIATVQYGPGDSRLCHTDEERLEVEQLLTCTRVFLGLIQDATGVPEA